MTEKHNNLDSRFLRRALALARRGLGTTSPNPMVGAVVTRGGKIIGEGFHARAGEPHAEINALRDAARRGNSLRGATLYVTLEPCCTHGRTPPCTDAIIAAGLKRVVIGAIDPNPKHAGRGIRLLQRARVGRDSVEPSRNRRDLARRSLAPPSAARGRIAVTAGVLADEATRLNEAFNHWIVQRTPFVTVKAAMTLDGKIATAGGDSKWITGPAARAEGMKLRQAADAILVGVNTVRADDPALTVRKLGKRKAEGGKQIRRIILDSRARTPLTAQVVTDAHAALTTIVVTRSAPARRVAALRKRVNVLVAPTHGGRVHLRWLLRQLGRANVTSLLVEGGGEVNAAFLEQRLAQRVAFFYAPKILGGRDARHAVAGAGARSLAGAPRLAAVVWRRVGEDLMMTARIAPTVAVRPRTRVRAGAG